MSNSKRILYFSRDFSTHDHRFLTSLAGNEFEVYYLRLENKHQNFGTVLQKENIQILPALNQTRLFSYKNILSNLSNLRKIIKEINPDLIHAGPIQTCSFLVALVGFDRLITMSWGSDILVDSEKNFFLKWVTRFTLSRTSGFIGDCLAVKQKAIEFGFPKDKITIFPWGIDLETFKPGRNDQFRQKLNWEDNFVILSLRSWEAIYGVDILIRAFIQAHNIEPNLRLILLGRGSQEKIIHELISKSGISEFVYLGGVIDQNNLPNYYHASDLYISASYSDGSSVSLMEALACGLPVLVSDIEGNKEWIIDQDNGWLFQAGVAENLAMKILEIYRQKDHLYSVKTKARNTAEKKANWNTNVQLLLNTYQMVLNS